MMLARLLARAFMPGLFLIALGIVLVALGAILDHYDMTRSEWYAGELGLVLLGTGGALSFLSVMAVLFVAGGDGDGSDVGSGGDGGGGE